MTNSEEQALLNLAMHAAMADGAASSDERNALEKLCQDYDQLGVPMPSPDAAVRAGVVKEMAAKFRGTAHAKLAYELAVVVCDSDGSQGPEEKAFLEGLKKDLGLEAAVVQAVQAVVQSVVGAPPAAPAGVPVPVAVAATPMPQVVPVATPPTAPVNPPAAPAPVAPAAVLAAGLPGVKPILAQTTPSALPAAPVAPAPATSRDLEPLILDRALLAGALEKIPEGYATLGLSQIQVRLVETISKAVGNPVDRAAAGAFVASLGVGQAAQAIEGFFAKALKGLLGHGTPATAAYASTYAIGRTASQNFSKLGSITAADLKDRFELFRQRGQVLQTENAAAIAQLAGKINVTNLPSLIRGPVSLV